MPSPKKSPEPKLLPATPRKRGRGRPLNHPPIILCDICRKNPACWQRPIRLANGELLMHCDSKLCDQAYIKLAYKTKYPIRQTGHLSTTATKSKAKPITHPTRKPIPTPPLAQKGKRQL